MTKLTTHPAKDNPNQYTTKLCDGFRTHISNQGFQEHAVRLHGESARLFLEAMNKANLQLADLTDETIEEIIDAIANNSAAYEFRPTVVRLKRFRDYLIEQTDAPKRTELNLERTPRDCLRTEYIAYLKEQRGLSEYTVKHSVRFFDLFLTYRFGDGIRQSAACTTPRNRLSRSNHGQETGQ